MCYSHTTRKPLNDDGYDDFVWFLLTSGSKQDVSSILTTFAGLALSFSLKSNNKRMLQFIGFLQKPKISAY